MQFEIIPTKQFEDDLRYYLKKKKFKHILEDVDDIVKELSDVCDITGSSLEQKALTDGEITMKGINKSYGMRKYLELHGLSREDTIAFGDGPNDLDMIEYAGIGVAMGNARQELKDIADYVTKDISDNGIKYAMEHFGLI